VLAPTEPLAPPPCDEPHPARQTQTNDAATKIFTDVLLCGERPLERVAPRPMLRSERPARQSLLAYDLFHFGARPFFADGVADSQRLNALRKFDASV
jgi:hypothetical protein